MDSWLRMAMTGRTRDGSSKCHNLENHCRMFTDRYDRWEVDIIAADRVEFTTDKVVSSDEEEDGDEPDGLP